MLELCPQPAGLELDLGVVLDIGFWRLGASQLMTRHWWQEEICSRTIVRQLVKQTVRQSVRGGWQRGKTNMMAGQQPGARVRPGSGTWLVQVGSTNGSESSATPVPDRST